MEVAKLKGRHSQMPTSPQRNVRNIVRCYAEYSITPEWDEVATVGQWRKSPRWTRARSFRVYSEITVKSCESSLSAYENEDGSKVLVRFRYSDLEDAARVCGRRGTYANRLEWRGSVVSHCT